MKPALLRLIVKSVLVFLCLNQGFSVKAQHLLLGDPKKVSVEAGLNFGPTFFLGDLGGNRGKGTYFVKDINLELTKMMKGAFISLYPNSWIGLRFAAQYTYLSGEDYTIKPEGSHELWRLERNLDFKSNVWEAYTAIEFFPLNYMYRNYEDYDPKFRPYVFGGVGMFHFDPMGSIKNSSGQRTWYKLHPLRTEGQGMAEYPDKKPYKLTQLNLPMGFGVKIKLSDRVFTGTELLYRHTFTDYVDDVSTTYIDPNYFRLYMSPQEAAIAEQISDKVNGIFNVGLNRYPPGTQRGNPNKNDDYFSCVIKLGIKLGNNDNIYTRQTRCPHFY